MKNRITFGTPRLRAIFKVSSAEDRWREILHSMASISDWRPTKVSAFVHTPMIKFGVHQDVFLSNKLLHLYGLSSSPFYARRVFDEMRNKGIVSFTLLISSYISNNLHEAALTLFKSISSSTTGPSPNAFTFSQILRSCIATSDSRGGTQVHASAIKHGLGATKVLLSSLVNLYAKLGEAVEAFKAFTKSKSSDVVSCTTMIASLIQSGYYPTAVQLYVEMLESGITPNSFTYVHLLNSSSSLLKIIGKSLHAHMITLGIVFNEIVITSLADMYSKVGILNDAVKLSNSSFSRDVYSWTVLISGLAKSFKLNEAAEALMKMEESGVPPNDVSYLSILNGCSLTSCLPLGRQMHQRIIKFGFNDDVLMKNALLDMYMKSSATQNDGVQAFEEISSPDVVAWTALISGLTLHGDEYASIRMFDSMRVCGVFPNSQTVSAVLKACRVVKSLHDTRKLHGYVVKTDTCRGVSGRNALLDAYAASGEVSDAVLMLETMENRDGTSYTSLATRLNEVGRHEEAVKVLKGMVDYGLKMDGFALSCFVSSSIKAGSPALGRALHGLSVLTGLISENSVVNSLVNYYGKLGLAEEANVVLKEASDPDVVGWNSLILCLTENGLVSSGLSIFDEMRMVGVRPDSFTFALVIGACGRENLVELGLEYFGLMRACSVEPALEHYVGVIHLLGKSNRLEEALEVLETMPFEPTPTVYRTMINACRLHNNFLLFNEMARRYKQIETTGRFVLD